MREFFDEILADLPQAVLTAFCVMVFIACVLGIEIVIATPVPV